MVTHKLQLVNRVQRLIVVANGQVAVDGPAAEVIKRLQRPATQAQPTDGGNAVVGAGA